MSILRLTASNELLDFINERLESSSQGLAVAQPDLIAANFEAGKEDDLYRLLHARLKLLRNC